VSVADGTDSYLEVDNVGQAAVMSRRVRFGSHHRLKGGDYRPNRVLYLPMRRAKTLELNAAENMFIHLYRPFLNRDHMPRLGPGDLSMWTGQLLRALNHRQHVALYRFLARPDPAIPKTGRSIADLIGLELAQLLSEDEQTLVVRDLIARFLEKL